MTMIRTIFICLALFVGVAAYADTVSYTYDDAGRLTSATYPSGASIQYSYDAAGNMTAVAVTPAPTASAQQQKKPQAVAPKRARSAARAR
jgi:YD repeat-containing protein